MTTDPSDQRPREPAPESKSDAANPTMRPSGNRAWRVVKTLAFGVGLPIYLPIVLLFLLLLTAIYPLIWFAEECVRPGLRELALRRRDRRMTREQWLDRVREACGTTILEYPTFGWCNARIWWTPDEEREPAITARRDRPEAFESDVDLLAWDSETAGLVDRQFHLEHGRAVLVTWGNFRDLQRLLGEIGPARVITVESWRAYENLRRRRPLTPQNAGQSPPA